MRSDDPVQQRLEAADPLPTSEPLDPAFLARVRARLEEIPPMSTPTLTPAPTPARAGRPRWFPLVVAGGAAAALALAVGVGVALNGDDSQPAATGAVTTVSPETSPPGDTPAVVERPPGLEPAPVVDQGGLAMMSCLPFSPEAIAGAPVAFDGEVIAVDGTKVTFRVTQWFRGGTGDILETDGVYMSIENAALIGGPAAEVGQRYLVAAELYSDVVRPGACGWVQAYSADMAATYASAFAA